jgi:hypothetical protein
VHAGVTPVSSASQRLPTRIALPADCRIPRTLAIRASPGDEHQPWEQPYASRFLTVAGDEDERAWFHFCSGHHVEFLYWEATAGACERVIEAVTADNHATVDQWLARIAALIRGSAAMLHFCAAFDPVRYDPCLRPSMAAERDDFSGDMSRDFLEMMAARARMEAVLEDTGTYADALAELRRAQRFWLRHHGDVVTALHPGSSLLRAKLDRLRRERESFDPARYITTVVHSEEALRDYDDYFGVIRDDDMKIGDYFTQAVEKLAVVHRGFAMDAETRTALMRGDGALLATISETLDEPESE